MKTSEPLQQTFWSETELPLTQSAAGSPVKTLAMLESALALKVKGLVCGENTGDLLANYDPASSSWRTSQACLVSGSEPFSGTWPRSGMMLSGTVYRLLPSAPLTGGTASGLLPTPEASNTKAVAMRSGGRPPRDFTGRWPTPRANDAQKRGEIDPMNPRNGLPGAVKMWPTSAAHEARLGYQRRDTGKKGSQKSLTTIVIDEERRKAGTFATPQARDFRTGSIDRWNDPARSRNLNDQVGGSLSADWVEALMGFPIGWTFTSEKE